MEVVSTTHTDRRPHSGHTCPEKGLRVSSMLVLLLNQVVGLHLSIYVICMCQELVTVYLSA